LYPEDMAIPAKSWPPEVLRRLLGATMTGGGSLMVAGEPDDQTGQMHALNSLYYPDNQPMSPELEKVLKNYYAQDALLFRYTHGKDVTETSIHVEVPECVVRVLAAPTHRALVVQLLHTGSEGRWSVTVPEAEELKEFPIEFDAPGGKPPKRVMYVSPDSDNLQLPVPIKWEFKQGKMKFVVPSLAVHGTVVIQY